MRRGEGGEGGRVIILDGIYSYSFFPRAFKEGRGIKEVVDRHLETFTHDQNFGLVKQVRLTVFLFSFFIFFLYFFNNTLVFHLSY